MKRSSNVYAAETILDKKRMKGRVKYLVKWKNYDETNNTWEPLEHILDKGLIVAYNAKVKVDAARQR